MMLHQDGSRHEWLPGQPALDLIVTLDDATGEIYSAFLVAEEGTHSATALWSTRTEAVVVSERLRARSLESRSQ